MSTWIDVVATIRCSNQATYSATPHVDLTINAWALKPRWVDFEGSELKPDVSGFQPNSIARIREFELIVQDITVAEDTVDAADFGSFERVVQYLYASKLWLVSVMGSPRVWRDLVDPSTPVAYWTSDNGITLPAEIRRVSIDYGDGDNGLLSPVLKFRDVVPVVGVTIS